ncbi:serine/threonine-protein kinase [Actinocorallia sp. A-T 12471]|uniref:serine/threonine-protein kinase n=1 Tax=Actinocorallia sp. A-T 12471 TaxID=3089813 RepID=UPI0029CDF494|nr:serine/threonine-protein kinase [Actinocorallia sp. A-T 12471]MDX6738451.1 serine/threonine-protein kinase [Actinocorallia sp. A-T 12471]
MEIRGRYRLEERVKGGGHGEVWRGWDLLKGRAVAVKVLHAHVAGSGVMAAKFRQEAKIAARLAHPGITAVDDFGELGDGRWYLVMEYLAGQDLAEELEGHPDGFGVERAVSLGIQVAEALAVAHAEGIVHRDLKPGNLMLLPGDRVKICDFGIAHAKQATTEHTLSGKVIGTPLYMAPEQWLGAPVDARTDLYALGGILYAFLTGEPPFLADRIEALMALHLQHAPVPLRRRRPDVTEALADLVARLLAKEPDDRPGSASEVAQLLADVRDAASPPARAWLTLIDAFPGSSTWPQDVHTAAEQLFGSLPEGQIRDDVAAVASAKSVAGLGIALHNLGIALSGDRQNAHALQVKRQAVRIRRGLYADDPARYRPGLASSLQSLGTTLTTLRRDHEALPVKREAAELRRALHAADPDRYRADLATSVQALAVTLGDLDRKDEALPYAREAVELRRALYAADPGRHGPLLAACLHELSTTLSGLKQDDEALKAAEESITLRRALYAKDAGRHRAALASVLLSLGITLGNLGRKEQALAAKQEAVELRRALYAANPGRYRAPLATALTSLGRTLDALGRTAEAQSAKAEAAHLP